MKFTYKIFWVNTTKNRRETCEVHEQNIAIFIAKKKVNDGMQEVLIQIIGENGDNLDDAAWPAIDAKIEEIEKN